MSKHSHSYFGQTTFNDGHIHHFAGVTSKEASGVPHIHSMEGETTYNNEHEHSYSTKTGPVIPVPSGGHMHCYTTRVEYEDGHIHYIQGYTSVD